MQVKGCPMMLRNPINSRAFPLQMRVSFALSEFSGIRTFSFCPTRFGGNNWPTRNEKHIRSLLVQIDSLSSITPLTVSRSSPNQLDFALRSFASTTQSSEEKEKLLQNKQQKKAVKEKLRELKVKKAQKERERLEKERAKVLKKRETLKAKAEKLKKLAKEKKMKSEVEKKKLVQKAQEKKEKNEKLKLQMAEKKWEEKLKKQRERERIRRQNLDKKKEQAEKKEQPKKKEQAKKTASKPKKPKNIRSPYIFFICDQIPKLTEKFPEKSIKDRMVVASQNWKNLTEEEKKPFIELSRQDKTRKEEELVKYRKALGPKKPLSAFLLWSNQIRPQIRQQNPNVKITEIAKSLGEQWKTLSNDVKQKYYNEAENLKKQYLKEKEQDEASP